MSSAGTMSCTLPATLKARLKTEDGLMIYSRQDASFSNFRRRKKTSMKRKKKSKPKPRISAIFGHGQAEGQGQASEEHNQPCLLNMSESSCVQVVRQTGVP